MSFPMTQIYSTRNISEELIKDITRSLAQIKDFGSMEIFVQDGVVTQISVRTIKKTQSKK